MHACMEEVNGTPNRELEVCNISLVAGRSSLYSSAFCLIVCKKDSQ